MALPPLPMPGPQPTPIPPSRGALPGVVPQVAPGSTVSVMSNAQLQVAEDQQKQVMAAAISPTPEQETGLRALIQQEWEMMKSHRDSISGWSARLLAAERSFKGQYDPQQLAEIQRYGGSTVFARMVSAKCRGASALLRDVYLTADRPFGLEPPSDPEVPVEIFGAVTDKVTSEIRTQMEAGQQVTADQVRDRTLALLSAARLAAKKKASERCTIAEDKLDTILRAGGFYDALAEFLTYLPMFPFAVIKGPVVKIDTEIQWKNGQPFEKMVPRMKWYCVSPFDIWWTPGVSRIKDANIIERVRLTRAELNDALDLPGYDKEAVRGVLENYGRGIANDWDSTDSARAVMENRENPVWNRSGLITCLEYHGTQQGKTLLEFGFTPEQIPDPLRDYTIQAWLIGNYIIKAQLAPSPRKRHPYSLTSYDKVPGTPVGNSLNDILADLQQIACAALRALSNNMAMASGPQVVVNDERLAPGEDGESIFPWKRWHVTSDPVSTASTQKPIEFFQPDSRAAEILGVYKAAMEMADDASSIPRYVSGGQPGSGAGRTASGLAMLMGNASKVLQTVAANIDGDVMTYVLEDLLDLVLLTDTTDLLDGTESIAVKGVAVAMQRETMRSRQIEFLQVTANPIDFGIIGPKGRANVLRPVANSLGLPGEEIVPSSEMLDAQQRQAAENAALTGQPGHASSPPEAQDGQVASGSGNPAPAPSGDMGPRMNAVATRPSPGGAPAMGRAA